MRTAHCATQLPNFAPAWDGTPNTALISPFIPKIRDAPWKRDGFPQQCGLGLNVATPNEPEMGRRSIDELHRHRIGQLEAHAV